MSEVVAKKGVDRHIARPAISKSAPEVFISGETILDVAYTKTGAGAWTLVTLSDSMTEIATTGVYEFTVLAAEITTPDFLMIKLTSTNMADDTIILDLRTKLIDDLNDFDPAVDVVARVTLVDEVTTVSNIVNVTTITTTSEQVCDVFNAVQPYRPGVGGIIQNVQDSLSDPNADRYSIERLVRLLDKAQKDLNIRTKILRVKVVFKLTGKQNIYTLPTDTRRITRVLNPAGELFLFTHDEADEEFGQGWETTVGNTLIAIIYDKQNQKGFKTYPILEDPTGDSEQFTYVPTSDFGFIATIEGFVFSSDYGIAIISDTVSSSGDFGLLNLFVEISDALSVTMYTDVNCQTLTAAKDSNNVYTYSPLQVPETYDSILEHYVIGMALRDDTDTQNRELGREYLALYADLIQEAINDASKSSVNSAKTGRNNPSKYNSAF